MKQIILNKTQEIEKKMKKIRKIIVQKIEVYKEDL